MLIKGFQFEGRLVAFIAAHDQYAGAIGTHARFDFLRDADFARIGESLINHGLWHIPHEIPICIEQGAAVDVFAVQVIATEVANHVDAAIILGLRKGAAHHGQ